MFSLEASWAELPSDERLSKRKERLAPLMMSFFDWCRNQSVLPGSKLGSAITYALKYEETFKTVLADGSLVLSNNLIPCVPMTAYLLVSALLQKIFGVHVPNNPLTLL